jgi:hypothetical protein
MNGLNKLECYIAVCLKSLRGTNTLAYLAHSLVTKKTSVVNTTPGAYPTETLTGLHNKGSKYLTRIEINDGGKHSA